MISTSHEYHILMHGEETAEETAHGAGAEDEDFHVGAMESLEKTVSPK